MKRLLTIFALMLLLASTAYGQNAANWPVTVVARSTFNVPYSITDGTSNIDMTAPDSVVYVIRERIGGAEEAAFNCTDDAELTCADGSITFQIPVDSLGDCTGLTGKRRVCWHELYVVESGVRNVWLQGQLSIKLPGEPGAGTITQTTITVPTATGTVQLASQANTVSIAGSVWQNLTAGNCSAGDSLVVINNGQIFSYDCNDIAGGGTSGNDGELLTDDGAGGITSESTATYDGTTLSVPGLAASGTITADSVSVADDLVVGDSLVVGGTATMQSILPASTTSYVLGSTSRRWNEVVTQTLRIGDEIITTGGNLNLNKAGSVAGPYIGSGINVEGRAPEWRLYGYPSGSGGVDYAALIISGDSHSLGVSKAIALEVQVGDPTLAADYAAVFAKDVTSSAEVFVKAEGGAVSQISSHPGDAPESLYHPDDVQPPEIKRSYNQYVGGEIVWKRYDDRVQMTVRETFAAYNARMGLSEGDPGYMALVDWTDEQEVRKAARDSLRVRWQVRQARHDSLHAVWEARADPDEAEPTFDEAEPEAYEPREPPEHLKRYGVRLRRGGRVIERR